MISNLIACSWIKVYEWPLSIFLICRVHHDVKMILAININTWEDRTWTSGEASECGRKLTVYWFTGVKSPGQLFDGLQLTDIPSKFSTQEHWTSTPQSIPLTEASVFQKQQQAVDRMYRTHEYILPHWNHHCISTAKQKVTTESIYYLLDDLDVRIVGKNSFWCECTLESTGVNSRGGRGAPPLHSGKNMICPHQYVTVNMIM